MTTALDTGQTILPALMTETEAREKVARIRRSAGELRALLVEFDERQGWQALGYESMAACCESEFGWKKSHFYRQLQAAETEKALGVPIGDTPEAHLRPLAGKSPEVQREAFREATANGPATAAKVEEAVRRIERPEPVERIEQPAPVESPMERSLRIAREIQALQQPETEPRVTATPASAATNPAVQELARLAAAKAENREPPLVSTTTGTQDDWEEEPVVDYSSMTARCRPPELPRADDWPETVGEIDRAFFTQRGMSLADVLRVARRVVETSEDEEAGNNRRMAARAYLKKGA